jgi:hypothetical protein
MDEIFTITENPAYIGYINDCINDCTTFNDIKDIIDLTLKGDKPHSQAFIYKQIKLGKPFIIDKENKYKLMVTKNPKRYVVKSKLLDGEQCFFKITDIPKATGISLYNIHKKLQK